jgi:hypothetical protein
MDALDQDLRELLQFEHQDSLMLQAAFDDEVDAMTLLRSYVSAQVEAVALEDMVRRLLQWACQHQRFFKRRRLLMIRPRLEDISLGQRSGSYLATRAEYDTLQGHVIKFERTHFSSRLSRLVRDGTESRESAELIERERWAFVLANHIIDAELPAVKVVEATAAPMLTWLRLFGTRRAKTLRNRALTWQRVRDWLLIVSGRPWTSNPALMIDYMAARAAEPCGRTVPQGIMAALCVMEAVGQVREADRLSTHYAVMAVADNLTMTLTSGCTQKKVAQLYTVSMLVSLELLVVTSHMPLHYRAIAWVMLLMVWVAMRADDVDGLDPSRMVLTEVCWRGVLTRTKTTGPGKKVLEVPVFVHRLANLSGHDWLKTGFDIWSSEPFAFRRDYFVMAFADHSGFPRNRRMGPARLNAYMRKVLMELRALHRPTPLDYKWTWMEEVKLIPEKLAGFWTGHSPRHFLVSMAAAMKVSKEIRDHLGRWGIARQHQSNDYVLTARQIVLDAQMLVTQGLCDCSGGREYDETEALEALRRFAIKIDGTAGASDLSMVPILVRRLEKWSLGTDFPMLATSAAEPTAEKEFAEAELCSEEPREGPLPETRFFVVTNERSKFRRLHVRDMCGVFPWKCKLVENVDKITAGTADAVCKDCQKYIPEVRCDTDGSSSSGSSSSSEGAEVVLVANSAEGAEV